MSQQTTFELEEGQIVRIKTWSEFESTVRASKYHGWAFRGQGRATWPVQSSLSRHLQSYQIHHESWPIQERRILSLFQRKAHLFLDHVPPANDYFNWLGVMQHHGAPTRLIDFTWSPEVAAFFALERAELGTECAVWAVAIPKLWNTNYRFRELDVAAKDLSLRDPVNYEKYYLNNEVSFASTDNPFVMNQRIIAQSGTFVVPGILDKPLEEIVTQKGAAEPADWIVQLVMDVDKVRSDAMAALYRMNTSNATLFPGLDGMARSLAYELEKHWAYIPTTFDAIKDYDAEFEELKRKKLPS